MLRRLPSGNVEVRIYDYVTFLFIDFWVPQGHPQLEKTSKTTLVLHENKALQKTKK